MAKEPDNTAFDLPADSERVLLTLLRGKMRDARGLLRWSSNSAYVVAVEQDDTCVLAVYKPQRGERPLWDFPDGTLCLRETAAYIVSAALGWHIVPPTVLREGLRGVGSVQFYVVHDSEVNFFTLDLNVHQMALQRFAAFDYIINNADRKGGHCLVDPRGRLWGIDHGIGFHVTPKLRTVIWEFAGQPVPAALLADVERLYCVLETTDNPVTRQLTRLLAEPELDATMSRIRKLLQRREYPRPGPGPNHPWPPI